MKSPAWPPNLSLKQYPDSKYMRGLGPVARFQTNSFGIRGREIDALAHLRIVTIGGSTTQSGYVDQEKTWVALLEKKLSKDRKIWIGNLGRDGYSMADHIHQTQFVLTSVPDINLVLLMAGLNDFIFALANVENPGRNQVTLPEAILFPKVWEQSRIYRLIATVARKDLDVMDQYGANIQRLRLKRQKSKKIHELPPLTDRISLYRRHIRELIDGVRSRDATLICITHPVLWKTGLSTEDEAVLWLGANDNIFEVENISYYTSSSLRGGMDHYNKATAAECQANGIEVFDASAKLSGVSDYFYDDAHLTERGSGALADLLFREMDKRRL